MPLLILVALMSAAAAPAEYSLTTPVCENEHDREGIKLTFPVAGAVNRDWFVSKFQDHAFEKGVMRDYRGGQWLYDNHFGTDFAVLGFPAMDRGIEVLSAASGTVTSVRDGQFDRNTCSVGGVPAMGITCTVDQEKKIDPKSPIEMIPDDGNTVVISHEGRWFTLYKHLRMNSTKVRPGQAVQAGQPIAQVGSSGFSSLPHLHFEIVRLCKTRTGAPGSVLIDPFHYKLWNEKIPYPGEFIAFLESGVSNQSPLGILTRGAPRRVSEFRANNETGEKRETIHVYAYLYGTPAPSDRIRYELRRPSGALYAQDKYAPTGRQPDVFGHWNYVNSLAQAETGRWKMIFYKNDVIFSEETFVILRG